MPPRKKVKVDKATVPNKVPHKHPATPVVFPEIEEKESLECYSVLEDQILIVDVGSRVLILEDVSDLSFLQDFLSSLECKEYVKFIDSLPLELTPPKKRGEAERVNRTSLISPT